MSYALGISACFCDSAVSLRDGETIAAAQEERFSRTKNGRRFPSRAINYGLREGLHRPSRSGSRRVLRQPRDDR